MSPSKKPIGNSAHAEMLAVKSIFNYNLIVAYLIRGELDKAEELAGKYS